jgi:hypothetical protein
MLQIMEMWKELAARELGKTRKRGPPAADVSHRMASSGDSGGRGERCRGWRLGRVGFPRVASERDAGVVHAVHVTCLYEMDFHNIKYVM